MKLRVSNVLITGGSSGIGLAIAKRLAEGGAKVVLTGRREGRLLEAQAAIGANCTGYLVWDVAEVEKSVEMFRAAQRMMGGLDGLVNNAALSTEAMGRGYEPWDITPDEWSLLADADLKAPFFLMRDMVDFLRAQRVKGNILNISSNAACMDILGPYSTSKLSILKLTRAYGKRFGKDGIIINGIAPGATFTPMISSYAKRPDDPYDRLAIGRFIRPEEIAELAAYLMSDMGEIICGHTVIADGGDSAATL